MDYGLLITRSFTIIWRYKYLWLLGALGGGEGVSAYNPTSNLGSSFQNRGGGGPAAGQAASWLSAAAPWLVVLGVLLLLLLIAYFFVSCISTGALVRATAEHDAERPFDLRLAWQTGLGTFVPILALRLLVLLFVVVVVLLLGGLIALGVVSIVNQQGAAAALAFVVAALLLLLLIPIGIGAGIAVALATRAIVLEQLGAIAALERGFRLLFGRLGRVLLVWLLSIALGIGASLVLGLALVVVGVPLALLGLAVYAAGGLGAALSAGTVLLFLFTIVSILASGAVGSYLSAYWTLAFRRFEIDVPPPTPPAPAPAYPAPPAV
jgi:hypothetical protein